MQTRALLVCVLATLALAQAYTVICNIDVVITGADTSGYENCCCVNSVTITNNALIHTIDFPTISIVFGDVIIENNPNLETIPWYVDTIEGKLSVQNNAYLYGFPEHLAHVAGDLTIASNDQLSTVTATWLWGTNSLNIHDNSHLTVADFPALTFMQYMLQVQNNPLLTTLTLTTLNYASDIYVKNTGLSTLNLLALTQVENDITIQSNPNLGYVEMGNLLSVSNVDITGNYNGNIMYQLDFQLLQSFVNWNSQACNGFTSCNPVLMYYYGATCTTAQSVSPKPAMYPAIEEKKKTKKDFFAAKLKLAAKANTPARK